MAAAKILLSSLVFSSALPEFSRRHRRNEDVPYYVPFCSRDSAHAPGCEKNHRDKQGLPIAAEQINSTGLILPPDWDFLCHLPSYKHYKPCLIKFIIDHPLKDHGLIHLSYHLRKPPGFIHTVVPQKNVQRHRGFSQNPNAFVDDYHPFEILADEYRVREKVGTRIRRFKEDLKALLSGDWRRLLGAANYKHLFP